MHLRLVGDTGDDGELAARRLLVVGLKYSIVCFAPLFLFVPETESAVQSKEGLEQCESQWQALRSQPCVSSNVRSSV
jgi:hypothetical protein